MSLDFRGNGECLQKRFGDNPSRGYLSRELAKTIDVEVHCWAMNSLMKEICMSAAPGLVSDR